MLIIGLGHRRRVGKDLVAKLILQQLRMQYPKLNIQKRSFAAKLKEICFDLYHWGGLENTIYYENNPDAKEIKLPLLNKSPREIWIEVGNKMREVVPTTWLDYIVEGTKCDVLIISDLRYPNEMEKIHKKNGFCFKVKRNTVPKSTDIADTSLEGYWPWDYIIENESSFNDLGNNVKLALEKVHERLNNDLRYKPKSCDFH